MHAMAGKTVRVKNGMFQGEEFTIEDAACNVMDEEYLDDMFFYRENYPIIREFIARRRNEYPDANGKTGDIDPKKLLYGKIDFLSYLMPESDLDFESVS